MNEGYVYRETVRTRAEGQRVEDYLARHYRHSSFQTWLDHLAQGRVTVDGAPVTRGTLLVADTELAFHRPAWEEPSAPLDYDVLMETDDLVVVHKPPGLPTMPGGGFLTHTLLHRVRLGFPDSDPMHRLGRWTSGAVVFAKTSAAARSIGTQFTKRTVYKRYRALASGLPAEDRFTIRAAIGPVPYEPLGTLHAACREGRASCSHVVVVRRRSVDTLVDVRIETGRPHQIRIHLAFAGHPLVNDPLYGTGGTPLPGCTALPGDPGYLLHAHEIRFDDPTSGARHAVCAPLPALLL
jgi:23S rRNA pseudouridine1911/1915/1917 synthase